MCWQLWFCILEMISLPEFLSTLFKRRVSLLYWWGFLITLACLYLTLMGSRQIPVYFSKTFFHYCINSIPFLKLRVSLFQFWQTTNRFKCLSEVIIIIYYQFYTLTCLWRHLFCTEKFISTPSIVRVLLKTCTQQRSMKCIHIRR